MNEDFLQWLNDQGVVVEIRENGNIINSPKEIIRYLWRKFLEWLNGL